MNRGMYNANNGVIGNIWRQKVSPSAKQDPHPISQLDEDVYNLFSAWNFDLPDNADDINNFIINLKCELGIQQLRDVFDCFYITAAATQSQSLTNWAQPGTYDLTIDNTTGLIFTPLKGWRTPAFTSAGFINTNFRPWTTICNFNSNAELWSAGNTQSLYDYGGSMGFYVTNKPAADIVNFTYDLGSTFGTGANDFGITIALTQQSYLIRLAIYNNLNSQISSLNSPLYAGINTAAVSLYESYPFYSVVKSSYNDIGFFINGDFKVKLNSQANSTTSTTNLGSASCPGPIIFPGRNTSTTGLTTKGSNSGNVRQYGFVFFGSRDIDQTILYNNLNAYLTSIDAAMVNS